MKRYFKIIKLIILVLMIQFSFSCKKKTVYINEIDGVESEIIYKENLFNPFSNHIKEKGKRYTFGSVLEVEAEVVEKFDSNYYKVISDTENEYIKEGIVEDTLKKIYLSITQAEGVNIYFDQEKTKFKVKIDDETKLILKAKYQKAYSVEYAENQFGYVDIESVTVGIEKSSEYYRVNPKSGLILRERADQNSKKLDLLPLHFVGKVILKDSRVMTISNRLGYWIYTDYESKKGWIFSGFVNLHKDKNFLTNFIDKNVSILNETYIESEVKPTKSSPDGTKTFLDSQLIKYFYSLFDILERSESKALQKPILKNDKNFVEEKLNERYSFRNIMNKSEKNCDQDNYLSIIDNLNKIEHKGPEIYSENILYYKKNVLITSIQYCLCCCGSWGERIYFFLENKILYYDLFGITTHDVEQNCHTISLKKMKYSEKDNSIYVYTLLPICEKLSNPNNKNEPTTKLFDYETEVFIVLKIKENELKTIRYYDKSIPKEYIKSYEESEFVFQKNHTK